MQNLWDKCSSLFCYLLGAWTLAQLLPRMMKQSETQQQEEAVEGQAEEEDEAQAPHDEYLSFTNMIMVIDAINKVREWTMKGR